MTWPDTPEPGSPEGEASVARTRAKEERDRSAAQARLRSVSEEPALSEPTTHGQPADPLVLRAQGKATPEGADFRPGAAEVVAAEPAAGSAIVTESSRRAVMTRLSDVPPETVEFLWAGRLPRGKLVVIDGDPGVGKSTLALTIAAHVTTGTPWPDGTSCPSGGVVLLSAEDGLADTVRPRLDAAGADASRVMALQGALVLDEDGEQQERSVTLADVTVIEEAINASDAILVIVDVFMAYVPSGTDAHRDSDVRSVLHRLSALAERTGATVLLLRHLNKSAGGAAIYRGGGSIGIIGAARAGFVAAHSPEADGTVILASTKSNLCKPPASLSYRLVDTENGAARVEWLGESPYNAHDVTRPPTPDEDADERDGLATYLRQLLTDQGGQARASDVLATARKEFGASESAVKRARKRAGITTSKDGMTGGWFWKVEEVTSAPEEAEEVSSQDAGLFGPFVTPSVPDSPTDTRPDEFGPCSRCGERTVRYGEHGHAWCRDCQDGAA